MCRLSTLSTHPTGVYESYANGDKIAYSYNSEGNLTSQTKNGESAPYVTYEYNSDGDLTQKTNTDTGLKYSYDGDNVTVTRISDGTVVQSYKKSADDTEDETDESDEEDSTDSGETVEQTHFGLSYTLSSQDNSITYSGNGGIVAYSVTPISDDDEKAKSENISFNGKSILSSSYTYDDNGNVLTKKYSDILNFVNEYDSKDRITSTTFAGKTTNYTYDSDGQLVSANDDTYAYDSRGNITSKTESGTTTTFTYSTDGWKDLLVKVNDDDLTYDANGNVLTYGDKKFTWNTGRTLESIVDGDNTYSYTYDENGIRTSKTVNGVTTYYNTDNGVILSQTDGTNTWYFQYDTNGTPLGFVLNGTQYFYITNQMGDILAITDANGDIVGNYEYDAWGKVLTADTDIAKQNPLRYRGYYYDNETGYYYLQSRYYDSNICRFVNADIAEFSQKSKNVFVGANLFAYCSNDAINNSDLFGESANSGRIYVFYYPNLYDQASHSVYYYWRSKNVIAYKVRNSANFIHSWNKMKNPYRVYLYLHGAAGKLYFHEETTKIAVILKLCRKIKVKKGVYLFSCSGGAGNNRIKVSYAFAKLTNTYVVASPVGVSYGYSGATLERFAKIEFKYYYLNYYWHMYNAYLVNGKWIYKSKNLNKKEILY